MRHTKFDSKCDELCEKYQKGDENALWELYALVEEPLNKALEEQNAKYSYDFSEDMLDSFVTSAKLFTADRKVIFTSQCIMLFKINSLRHIRGIKKLTSLDEADKLLYDGEQMLFDGVHNDEFWKRVDKFIDQMPQTRKKVMKAYVRGEDVKQTAKKAGTTKSGVISGRSQGKISLQKKFKAESREDAGANPVGEPEEYLK